MRRTKSIAWLSLLAFALILNGCRHPPATQGTGKSSFTVLDPPSAPSSGMDDAPKVELSAHGFREARPFLPLAEPIYPARALAAKAGRAVVGVRIIVDTTGRISSVTPSLRIFSTPGPFADDFLEAVRTALRQWRFLPAAVEHREDNGTSDNEHVRLEAIETYYDISFIFTATGGIEAPAIGR